MSEPISVGELASWLKEHLEENFSSVAVVGEITALRKPGGAGHLYFELKDATNRVHCTCWKGNASRLRFAPADGLQVIVQGCVTYYGPQSKTQINVQTMQAVGLGSADLARRVLIEKLRGLGWLDRPRKILPRFPRRVALVTSASGAAVRDMIQSFATRWPLCEVVVAGCRVQGEAAPAEIAAAVKTLSEMHATGKLPLDAIIVGRGGGSAEDLNAFNAEVVAAAIVACAVPVVSAVGHEIDVTIADMVADVRAETPSNAVTRLTPNQGESKADLIVMRDRFRDSLMGKVTQAQRRLSILSSRPAFTRPLDRIRRGEQRLDDLGERLKRAMQRRVEKGNAKVAALAAQLESVSPLNVLSRGYSLTRTATGEVLRDVETLKIGDEMITTLAAGEVRSIITNRERRERS